jgi:hypothetical protein
MSYTQIQEAVGFLFFSALLLLTHTAVTMHKLLIYHHFKATVQRASLWLNIFPRNAFYPLILEARETLPRVFQWEKTVAESVA